MRLDSITAPARCAREKNKAELFNVNYSCRSATIIFADCRQVDV